MVMSSGARFFADGKLRVRAFHRFKNERLRTLKYNVMAIFIAARAGMGMNCMEFVHLNDLSYFCCNRRLPITMKDCRWCAAGLTLWDIMSLDGTFSTDGVPTDFSGSSKCPRNVTLCHAPIPVNFGSTTGFL